MDFRLLKGALCAAISLWDSGIGSGAQKQSSLFISWKASEQVSQSRVHDQWVEREREGKREFKHVCGVDSYCYIFTCSASATMLFSHSLKPFILLSKASVVCSEGDASSTLQGT